MRQTTPVLHASDTARWVAMYHAMETDRPDAIFRDLHARRLAGAKGWEEVEFRSMWEESIRLERTARFARFWQSIGRLYPRKKQQEFRRMSGVVLMHRIAAEK